MRVGSVTLLAVVALASPPAAASADPQALPTARTHVLKTRPGVAAGIEATMPKGSRYAQGVALDLEERFEQSVVRFHEAEHEFEKLPPAAAPPGTAQAWQRKCRWQAQWSQQLALLSRGLRPFGAPAAADLGHAYFLKFLAARAFTGQPPLRLAQRARALLEDALRREPEHLAARVSLATLLHEVGEPLAAQREFARVRLDAVPLGDGSLDLRLASYWAAAGERHRALEQLERLFRQRPYMVYALRDNVLRWSNEFDRLRDEPRFQRLIDNGPPAPAPRPYHRGLP
jgi:hypothetical protein